MLNPIKTSDFDAIKLSMASPEDILEWSNGQVTRPETINYRTQKPEKDGLFCERIFGPTKDWECYCGKYKKIRYKGIICDKCGVEVTRSIVRRERMGHIELQTPCSHIWFLRGISSKIGLILDLSMQALEKVIYFASFIVTDVDEELKNQTIDQIKQEFKDKKKTITEDFKRQEKELKASKSKLTKEGLSAKEAEEKINKELDILSKAKEEKLESLTSYFNESSKELKDLKPMLIVSEDIYQSLSLKYGHIFEAGIGAEAIRKVLSRIDLKKTIKELDESYKDAVDSKKEKMIKRLKILKSLDANNIRPEWMILTNVPVIPPDLRPMVSLEGGRFATSDLNDLYRRVINRNNRLKQLIDLNAPEVICRNEKRMLQEAVDALIDNSARASKTVVASTGQKRQLKSLADSLKGKQGRFRQNLLGKRTDYSGRSVIVVNPKLNLDQCGLPKLMALELFKPFIISKLIQGEIVHNVRSASRYIEAGHDEVWDILEEIVSKAHVLLNRAPTLHRLGIQAFKPTLIEGKAIQIHPMVCTAFNADFDGDQMAVHVPLTEEANMEASEIMLSSKNLLKPATGDPIVSPNQDIVWGSYYITIGEELSGEINEDDKSLKAFTDENEAKMAYDNGYIKLHDPIKVRIKEGDLIKTTVGRVLFNEIIPDKLRFVNKTVKKGDLKNLVRDCLRIYGLEETVEFVDNLKNEAFALITKSGWSFGMSDIPYIEEVDKLIKEAEGHIIEVWDQFDEGLLTESERSGKVIEIWSDTKEKITEVCKQKLTMGNPVHSMIESGARGSWAQLTQIIGMKGLVTSPSGGIIELPVKGNFKKGFDVLEYFISSHGVRKGLSDTALRTANAGYLTRRLVDVSQDVIISEDDCGDKEGVTVYKKESEEMGETLIKRITGRFLAKDLKDASGKVLAKAGEAIDDNMALKLKDKDIEEATIRTVLNCSSERGICAKCYGYDLGNSQPVKIGTPVGIVAAQSIGEPGTQLTMRTFHTGGVASQEDITQGLPRVEEIFEARTPKKKAIISEVDGRVKIESEQKIIKDEKGKEVMVTNPKVKILKIEYKGESSEKYKFTTYVNEEKSAQEGVSKKDLKVDVKVKDGDEVKKGDVIFTVGKKEIKVKDSGKVKIDPKFVKITSQAKKVMEYIIPKGMDILVGDGDKVEKGQRLTDGSFDLQQLYKLRDRLEVQKYIIKEIQYVYSSQGQPLNDKHVEIIARQMFSRFLIKDSGESQLLPGEVVEETVLARQGEKIRKTIKSDRLLSGITKASLTTESFLSAASFQETARVLIEAALSGKIDYLEGLKENVIIGCLVPAGTGYKGKKKRVKY
ncbi:DNA-directed RNA polymerase subunit beta' [Candidatus Falkowbacteria bacterium]|nr:DNA-directed RNA polymerase subunit beta' [Candidatus Falkowbacteria bacterium]